MQNNQNLKITEIINNSIRKLTKIDHNLFDDNSNLVSEKVLDSLGLVSLLLDLEKQFNISFNEDDMLSEELMTSKGLALIISSKVYKTQ
jgi:acyl carrier protein